MRARDYTEPHDLPRMQRLQQEVWRADPLVTEWTTGALAWLARQHVGREAEWRRRVWLDNDRVFAWGWLRLADALVWQVHPDRPELIDEVLDWFDAEAVDGRRETAVRTRNDAVVSRLEARGYAHDPDEPWMLLTERALEEIEEPRVPNGYVLRTVRGEEDLARRVAVHRSAFDPSRVTEESYANVMRTPPYRPELDCVVEAPDGSFAAYALAWLDEENGCGELEPVGAHPDHRRRGLARAVNLFALRQLRAAGARRAVVGCRGDAAYPAPKALYESVGFRELTRSLPYTRS